MKEKSKNFHKKLFFRHFICYLYKGKNKIKNFCFQGCRSRIFCTTYIEGKRKIFIKKGLGISQKSKIKFAVCGYTRFACYSVRMAVKTNLIFGEWVLTRFACCSQNKRKQRCYLMDNENKFKVSISSMLDYELPNITVRFDDCKTEYIFTGTYEGSRAVSSKLLKMIDNDKISVKGADK